MRPFALVFLLFSLTTLGADVGLVVWRPPHSKTRLVPPADPSAEPAAAARRYLAALHDTPALADLVANPWLTGPAGEFGSLAGTSEDARLALIDNSFGPKKVEVGAFGWAGADAYLIPLGAELALATAAERAEFRRLVATRFDALVALGGADVAPELYGEPVTFAIHTNALRDRLELALIRSYLAEGHGDLYGICRGQQIIAVSEGYKLYQDLSHELGVSGHESGWHAIDIVAGTVLSRFAGGVATARVDSYHHQAVRLDSNPAGPLRVSATAGKVVEGLETADGRIITVQFHPELMDDELGDRILRGMVQRVSRVPR